MSLYTRVHTPNSPLLPLSPMPSSAFLSPYTASLGSRRSFTPNHLNILPPPSLSPIRAGILSNKRKSCDLHQNSNSSESEFKRPLPVPSSTQKSMKSVRSSARLIIFSSWHAIYLSLFLFFYEAYAVSFHFISFHFNSTTFFFYFFIFLPIFIVFFWWKKKINYTEKWRFEIHMLVYH